jgi:hypothetical protein
MLDEKVKESEIATQGGEVNWNIPILKTSEQARQERERERGGGEDQCRRVDIRIIIEQKFHHFIVPRLTGDMEWLASDL